ncbi:hypothetical protein J8J27_33105, partial [Mycobacterium tuberculosis]|nr:hypothetical protein [Mycobacterium tuberculosis]
AAPASTVPARIQISTANLSMTFLPEPAASGDTGAGGRAVRRAVRRVFGRDVRLRRDAEGRFASDQFAAANANEAPHPFV